MLETKSIENDYSYSTFLLVTVRIINIRNLGTI